MAKVVTAADFAANCLALIEEVAETDEETMIVKNGKTVAKIVPIDRNEHGPTHGRIEILDDIVEPVDDE